MKKVGLVLATFLIWALVAMPMFFLGLFVIPTMLAFKWEGYTTWFGNRKYGRYGNAAAPSETFFDSFNFLAIRNPVSNFGKEVIALTPKGPIYTEGNPDITDNAPFIEGQYLIRSGWMWELRFVKATFPGKCLEARFGWKLNGKTYPTEDKCTFVFRFNPFRTFK